MNNGQVRIISLYRPKTDKVYYKVIKSRNTGKFVNTHTAKFVVDYKDYHFIEVTIPDLEESDHHNL